MDPGSDVFEITDHTSATAYEEFISTLEETFGEKWKLAQFDFSRPLDRDVLAKSSWNSRFVDIENISNFEYRLTLYHLRNAADNSSPSKPSHHAGTNRGSSWKSLPSVDADRLPSYESATHAKQTSATNFASFDDLLSGKNEFVQSSGIRDCHVLVDWFPMRMFVVITPLRSRNRVLTETDAHTLDSCVLIALSNCGCSVPVFVQVSEPWRQMFRGLMLHGHIRVTFNTVHLRRAPDDCQHMSELLDNIFKEELGCQDVAQRPQIKIGLKFTYSLDATLANSVSCSVENCILDAFQNSSQPVRHVSFARISSPRTQLQQQSNRLTLPIRALESPVYDALVSAIWPSVYADTVTESRSFTDLDPLQAPKWTCKLTLNDNYCTSLYEIVRAFAERLQPDTVSSPRLAEYSEIYKKFLFQRKDVVNQQKNRAGSTSTPTTATTNITSESNIANMGERALTRITESRFQSSLRRIQNSGIRERLQYASQLSELLSHAATGPGNFKQTPQSTASGIDYVDGAPIQQDLLMLLISFLFPRAPAVAGTSASESGSDSNLCFYPASLSYASKVSSGAAIMTSGAELHEDADATQFRKIKAAPCDSLPERLAIVCGLVRSGGTVGLFAFVWLQFLQELRYCYDSGLMIDGVAPGTPDQSTCLLHQKLQMLNYCIERRISGQINNTSSNTLSISTDENLMDVDDAAAFVSPASSVTSLVSTPSLSSTTARRRRVNAADDGRLQTADKSTAEVSSGISSERDEFFDANDDEALPVADKTVNADSLLKPEGRKERYENFSLVYQPDIPLYVPYTQEPACATDDMLAELVAKLEAMGDSPESRARKACMQSESLYSDMQAFKAANPGCCIEDFVRWYSPRDLVVTEGNNSITNCRLSERMLIPGNTWSELWTLASPRPVARQKRLFDETQQAERVLRDLYELRLADVVQLLMPCLLTGAVHALAQRARSEVPDDAWRDTCGFGDKTVLKGLYTRIAQVLRSVHSASPFVAASGSTTVPSSAEGGLTLDSLTPILDEMRTFERCLLRHHYIAQRLATGGALAGVTSETEQEDQALIASLHGGNEFEIVGGSQAPTARLFYQAFAKSNAGEGYAESPRFASSVDRVGSSTSLSLSTAPIRKEYVFKCWYGRPVASECQPGPQRLYVSYSAEQELRMMSAFSEDVSWS